MGYNLGEAADLKMLLFAKFCVIIDDFHLLPSFVMDGDAIGKGKKRHLIIMYYF